MIIYGAEGIKELKEIRKVNDEKAFKTREKFLSQGVSEDKINDIIFNFIEVVWSDCGKYPYNISMSRRIGSFLEEKDDHNSSEFMKACLKCSLETGKDITKDIIRAGAPDSPDDIIDHLYKKYQEYMTFFHMRCKDNPNKNKLDIIEEMFLI